MNCRIYILLVILISLVSCKDIDIVDIEEFQLNVPSSLPDIQWPEENQFSQVRWQLGKKLFYDERFSDDNAVSCASCHKPHLAFSDEVALSEGSNGALGTRNSPTLTNVAYNTSYTRDGTLATLEQQILVPIQEHNEFNSNIILIADELANDVEYQHLSEQAYNRPLDYYVITRALATFERSLISGTSAYDYYSFGVGEPKTFSESAKRGMELFFSDKTSCFECHGGSNFTTYDFENNGLYAEYNDVGRYRFTFDENDIGKFKIPTLRNIELTGPYMHNGSISTLEEVIEHYNSGGNDHMNKSDFIRPLNLTSSEKSDLVAFLKSLTDPEFISNKHLAND